MRTVSRLFIGSSILLLQLAAYAQQGSIMTVSGTPQSALVNSTFSSPLSVIVKDGQGAAVPGVQVTFQAPVVPYFNQEPTGTFGGASSVNVLTDQSGVATAPAIQANSYAGSYSVSASAGSLLTSFSLTNLAGAASSISASSGTPQSAPINTAYPARLGARVTDSFGNPVAGAQVTFSTPAAGPSAFVGGGTAANAVTGANGIALSPVVTANQLPGSFVATASINGQSASYNLTNTGTTASPLPAVLSFGNQQVGTISSFQVVNYTNAGSNDLTYQPFVITGDFTQNSECLNPLPPSATCQISVRFQPTAVGTRTGTLTITDNGFGSPRVVNLTGNGTPGQPTTITLVSGSGQTTPVNTQFPLRLVAVVKDAQGNPTPGVSVTFTAPQSGSNPTATFSGSPVVVTDNAGLATSPPLVANLVEGSYQVLATASGIQIGVSFGLTNGPPGPSQITILGGNFQSATVNTQFATPFRVRVTNSLGNPVANEPVTFSAPGVGASGQFSSPATVLTDAQGIATAPGFTAGSTAGSYIITATVANLSPAQFFVNNAPAGGSSRLTIISGTPQSALIGTTLPQPFVVKLTDAFGNPLVEEPVVFTAPAAGPSGTFPDYGDTATAISLLTGGRVSREQAQARKAATRSPAIPAPTPSNTAVVYTDNDGIAAAPPFTTNLIAGSYQVVATYQNAVPVVFDVTNVPGSPAGVSTVSGTPQTTLIGSAFQVPLQVLVVDANGNPVPDAQVVFQTPQTGSGGTFSGSPIVRTDAKGIATAPTLIANGIPGTFVVEARSGAAPIPARFTLSTVRTLTITTDALPSGVVGQPYGPVTLSAVGGVAPLVWTATGLPAGLNLSSNGIITGTPTTAGLNDVVFTVRDSNGGPNSISATRTLSLRIDQAAPALTITTSALPTFVVGTPVSTTIQTLNGVPPLTFRLQSGNIPGLTLSTTGVLSGTPTTAGSFPIVVRVTDLNNQLALQPLTAVVINPPANTPTLSAINPPSALAGSQTLNITITGTNFLTSSIAQANGSPLTTTFQSATQLIATLPAALLVSPGSLSITVVNPNLPASNPGTFTITPRTGTPLSISVGLPQGLVGQPYAAAVVAAGGQGPYKFSVTGALPAGLSFNVDNGLISGVPTTPGSSTLTFQVTDALNATASTSAVLIIRGPDVELGIEAPPRGTVNVPYNFVFLVSGGVAPYRFSQVNGILPPGLQLSPDGILSGTPTTAGTFGFTVQVNDAQFGFFNRLITLVIDPPAISITTAALPNAAVGTPYSATLQAVNGRPPFTWSLADGTLPNGITLAATGNLTGTPTAPGTFTFTVRATDTAGASATRSYTVIVSTPLVITTNSPLPDGIVGGAYSVTFAGTGGTAPFAWTVSAGSLPAGLTLATNGVLSGTPTAAGTSTFTVQLTDGGGRTVTKAFTLTVTATLQITTATLPGASTGVAYSQTLAAAGGTAPYTWAVATGSLPAGLSLNAATGLISGTPTATGTSSFTVRVTDSNGRTATRDLSIVVAQALSIVTSALPNGVVGTPYSQTLVAAGGAPPYTWSFTGTLPSNLTLDQATGVLSGTPTAAGTSDFTIVVTDSASAQASRAFSVTIALPPPPTVTITGLPTTAGSAQQPSVNLTLGSTFPVNLNGVLTLTFTSDTGVDDPAVSFLGGSRTAPFTVPANTNNPVFGANGLPISTGTLSGLITITPSLSASGTDVTPNPVPSVTVRVNRAVPVITDVRVTRTSTGLTIDISGFTNTREISRGDFRFTQSAGATPATLDVSVPLTDAFNTFFQGTASRTTGGRFTLSLPFNVQGTAPSVNGVTVTLTNSQGASAPTTVSF